MKKVITILMLVILLCGSALASEVTYVDTEKVFEFKPGSVYEATDLFENFKGVLPGDKLEERITVQNSSKKAMRIFLQCKYDSYATTEEKDFLNQLKLTVESGDTKIFEAKAGQKAQLSSPVLLGTFKEKGKVELKVKLEVPLELNSKYMGQVGVVPWTFIVEEVPSDGTPDTGDWFQTTLWIGIAMVLAAAIVVLLIVQRKRRAENN